MNAVVAPPVIHTRRIAVVVTREARRHPHAAVVGVAVVVLLGLTALAVPFTGDQALFAEAGQALAHGRPLYLGFWDMKQPAIFVFSRVAGGSFGYSEMGIHFAELVWQAAFAWLIVRTLRGRLRSDAILAIAPVLAVGTYYVIASPEYMTQVEVLIGLPILVAVMATLRGITALQSPRWFVVAGVAIYVVAMFKLMLIAVPLAGIAAILAMSIYRGSITARTARRALVLVSVGFMVPFALTALWLFHAGVAGEAFRTWFQVPLGVNHRAGRPYARLLGSVFQVSKLVAPLVPLAVVGLVRAHPKKGDPVALACVAWIVTGAAAFALQLWWSYLLFLLIPPLGILATFGLDVVWQKPRSFSPAAVLVALMTLAALSMFSGHRFAQRLEHLRRNDFALTTSGRRGFQFDESTRYQMIYEDAAYLRRLPKRDRVVVWGDPLYLYLSGRDQATAMNGWAPEHLDQRLWRRAARELQAAQPDVVFVDAFSARYIATRGLGVNEVLRSKYYADHRTREGVWYRHN